MEHKNTVLKFQAKTQHRMYSNTVRILLEKLHEKGVGCFIKEVIRYKSHNDLKINTQQSNDKINCRRKLGQAYS